VRLVHEVLYNTLFLNVTNCAPSFYSSFATWVPANLVLEKEEGVSKQDVQKPNNVFLCNPKIITVFMEAPHCNRTWATHTHTHTHTHTRARARAHTSMSLQSLFFMYGSGPVEEQWTGWVSYSSCQCPVSVPELNLSLDIKRTATLLLLDVVAVLKYTDSPVSGSLKLVLSSCSYTGIDL
jgi:hypothetical protein